MKMLSSLVYNTPFDSKDPRLNEFIENRQLKPNTVLNYVQSLNWYTEIVGKNLSDLIDEAEKDRTSEVVPNHIEYTIINAADSTVIRPVTLI
jgi:hypothetical protein